MNMKTKGFGLRLGIATVALMSAASIHSARAVQKVSDAELAKQSGATFYDGDCKVDGMLGGGCVYSTDCKETYDNAAKAAKHAGDYRQDEAWTPRSCSGKVTTPPGCKSNRSTLYCLKRHYFSVDCEGQWEREDSPIPACPQPDCRQPEDTVYY